MFKKIFAVTLVIALSNQMEARINGNDVLAGIATGAFARGTSYALKKQGNTNNSQAMLGAAVAAAVATVAWQTNTEGGSSTRGLSQIAIALATFVTSMYIWPTLGEDEVALASARIPGEHHDDHVCSGNCKHK